MIHIICDKCNYEDMDIMSCEQISANEIDIVFVCPMCGYMVGEKHYLYTKQKLKIN
ncbi:hypothetical protein CBC_A1640 [Clostridium botulinum C str. Eklund]|nr:hypothetical protein CBC_A1640 [Clostridium botulinum C str. Eklund]